MRTKGTVTTCSALFVGTLSTVAIAAEPSAGGEASGAVSLGGDTSGSADASAEGKGRRRADDRADRDWIKRWPPEKSMAELGLYGGVLLPSQRHELFEPDASLPGQGFKEFRPAAPSFGLRLGYYPSRFFGAEGEAGVAPTRTEDDLGATLWGMRVGLVGQLGLWSFTPFIVAGGGMLNVSSDRAAVGSDIDASAYVGGGVKLYLTRHSMLRIDVRDHITASQGVDEGIVHNAEALLGFSVTLGRKVADPDPDRDSDGIPDSRDKCPDDPGKAEFEGCPDTDEDGIRDLDDECPEDKGLEEFGGCPDTDEDGIRDLDDECPEDKGLEQFGGCPDTDGDEIRDLDDECPEEPGVPEYEGCPIPDSDEDGLLDPDDKCPLQPENINGYQDDDGCCDEIPSQITDGLRRRKRERIHFRTGKSTIKKDKSTRRRLNRMLKLLRDFPEINIEIVGHTDSRGDRQFNLQLSEDRANAVKSWLVDQGINSTRFAIRGAGPDEPIGDNFTKRGRAQNRRIDFKLPVKDPKAAPAAAKCEEPPPGAKLLREPVEVDDSDDESSEESSKESGKKSGKKSS